MSLASTPTPLVPELTRRTCVTALLSACLAPAALAQKVAPLPRPRPPVFMPPRMVAPEARLPVRLDAVSLRASVTGHAVHTRVELVFFNPNERVLEGELQFPLREGQWVSGFELDIEGELRPAVPVDKARGLQVFEDVIRARVDPALLEVTEGHHYKLRVYPLPPRGTRRVVLHLASSLDRAGRVVLPLRYGEPLERLDVQVLMADTDAKRVRVQAEGLDEREVALGAAAHGAARVECRLRGVRGAPSLTVQLPPRSGPLVATQQHAGRTHFYAELPLAARSAPRPAPRRIALLWDASGSAAQRDHDRVYAMLDAYFRSLREVEVALRIGRDVAEPAQHHSVKGGRWDSLRRALDGLAYDGASNLPALLRTDDCDLALLVHDGLSNWGEARTLAPSAVPLYALSDAAGADVLRLRHLAERSGGEWLDAGTLSPAEATRALHTRKARLLRLTGQGARELVAASPYADAGHIALAGVLTQAQAEVALEFELPDGRVQRQTVRVQPRVQAGHEAGHEAERGAEHVAQRWAVLRLAELEAEHEEHRAEIRRLGRAYGLASRETSLIVLDALADYVRHEIEPPPAWREAYERAIAQQGRRRDISRAQHLDRVAARFAEQVAWWERDWPKDEPPRRVLKEAREEGHPAPRAAATGRQEMAAPLPAPAAPAAAMRDRRAAESERKTSNAADADRAGPAPATIRLAPWSSDTPSARRLRSAPAEAVYQRYLDERPDHLQSTAFFLDAADVLADKGRPELALRVLSNLAEMDLHNRHILRVLAYRLLQARQAQLAIPVLRQVRSLSPHEPQSWRDLGLAHAEAQQWQEAADQLWEVVARPWDGRFTDIDLIALAELNQVLARAERSGAAVATAAYDRRLLRLLPLDLRITLAWDADNTDIDLWVTDPNGERVHYGHPRSYQGGRLSRDATGGYGPEEFALRVAKPGSYVVQAQFYGHRQQVVAPATTLMLRLSTGFGRADQRDELVTLRLDGPADLVTVGRFDVGR